MGTFIEATIFNVKKLYKPGFEPSDSTISRRIDLARDALGKAKHQLISISDFCDYYGIKYSE